jgi:activating signal cointegrator complex subunit 3
MVWKAFFQVYDSNKGRFADLGVLDVQQIFGRAGRPQFDTLGEAHIITTHDKLGRYLGMLTHSVPIESQFVKNLEDNLNAEVVLGTVSNIQEAATWLSYSYLFVRMTRNPLPYGLTYDDLATDPELVGHRRRLVTNAAKVWHAVDLLHFTDTTLSLPLDRVNARGLIGCLKLALEFWDDLVHTHDCSTCPETALVRLLPVWQNI